MNEFASKRKEEKKNEQQQIQNEKEEKWKIKIGDECRIRNYICFMIRSS